MTDKAILVVSFGTSYDDTRKATIGAIEDDIRDTFPDWEVRRAFTSRMIISKLKKRDNLHIDYVTEGLERLADDGFSTVVVVPTHVINGEEYDFVMAAAYDYAELFEEFNVSRPLLSTSDDYLEAVRFISDEMMSDVRKTAGEGSGLVLMGHGTEHPANSAYSQLQLAAATSGVMGVFVTTVEGWPGYDDTLKMMKVRSPKKVAVMPFMIVAGDHANNDMAGDDDSLKCFLEKAGFEVVPIIKGLGEYPGIRRMFLDRARDAISNL